ncbi:MAG: SDR family NAD(P)-dependent oxidoreductase [Flavobacteriales bacterium]|nr:SDR family NAD(P)-dependent oxidoreductase [Flavobacteriales bacterium]
MKRKYGLITAGHKGLGWGWSQFLTSRGYEVIIAGRSITSVSEAAESIHLNGGLVHAMQLDVSSEKSIQEVASAIKEKFGKLDLLVNNAGVNPKDYKDREKSKAAFNLEYLDPEALIEVYRVNSLGPILMIKHLKQLLELGEEKRVLNISSWLGSVNNLAFGGHYGYVSSKNLLNVLNKSAALEIKDSGIICVNVNPGWVKTEMGGKKANFTPLESAEMVYNNVLMKVEIRDTGKFYNYDGSIHPW